MNLNKINVRVYTASAMTGRTGEELVAQSKHVSRILGYRNITVLDPIAAENVKSSQDALYNSKKDLTYFWRRDKLMIREAHVVLDVTGPAKSEGVAHEIGYARYALWKPVIRVYPETDRKKISVAQFEDDLIVSSVSEAADEIVKRWGTPWKRYVWRTKLLMRCLPKWILMQLNEWK